MICNECKRRDFFKTDGGCDFRLSENERLRQQLATVTKQRDRAQAVVRIFDTGLGTAEWRTRHAQAIAEARENE